MLKKRLTILTWLTRTATLLYNLQGKGLMEFLVLKECLIKTEILSKSSSFQKIHFFIFMKESIFEIIKIILRDLLGMLISFCRWLNLLHVSSHFLCRMSDSLSHTWDNQWNIKIGLVLKAQHHLFLWVLLWERRRVFLPWFWCACMSYFSKVLLS